LYSNHHSDMGKCIWKAYCITCAILICLGFKKRH